MRTVVCARVRRNRKNILIFTPMRSDIHHSHPAGVGCGSAGVGVNSEMSAGVGVKCYIHTYSMRSDIPIRTRMIRGSGHRSATPRTAGEGLGE